MKRFFILILVFAILAAVRFSDNGLLKIRYPGEYTEFQNGIETVYAASGRPILAARGYARLDIAGGETEAMVGLNDLGATVLWQERVDEILILYAYSPYISAYETLNRQRVNVMVAVRNGQVSFGLPLLKGSY